MAIQVRRGNEADFDASKMLPGEWAVSLDTKYVRICLAPGLVLRMATYESFEADRAQIQAILAECKNIQTAIERIQVEVNSNAVLTVESANSAKKSADSAHGEAERALSEADRAHSEADKAHSEAERAKSYMDGAESVIGVKIADLYQTKAGAIIEKASGESPLCIRDTADNLVRNLKLYGNTEQDGTSGAQLIEPKLKSATVNGITLTYNEDGTYTLNGTATAQTVFRIDQSTPSVTDNLKGYDGTYTLSLDGNTDSKVFAVVTQADTWAQYLNTSSLSKSTNTFTAENCYVGIVVASGATLSNYVVKPMLNAGSTALPWEPYTGGQPSPNPDYPQEIRSVKGKNLAKSVSVETTTGQYAPALYLDADLKPSTTYTLSFGGTVGNGYYTNEVLSKTSVYFVVVDGITKCTFTTKDTLASTAHVDGKGWLLLKNSKANSANVFEDVQIEKGMFATPYVPYGCLRIKAHGKNLINQKCIQAGDALKHWLKAGTYNVSRDASESVGKTWYFRAQSADGTTITKRAINVSISSITSNEEWYYGGTSSTNWIFTLKEDCYVTIGSLDGSGTTYLMLVEGTEPAEYEPYTENSITISQPIELNGIGDVMDELTPYGVVRKVASEIVTHVHEPGIKPINTDVEGILKWGYDGFSVTNSALNNTKHEAYRNVMDDKFTLVRQTEEHTVESGTCLSPYGHIDSLQFRFRLLQSEYPTTADVVDAIVGTKLMYPLAEPIFEPLPTADQIALRSLMSYDGVTYISCDCEVEPVLEVECALDTKKYIDRKFAELATALV